MVKPTKAVVVGNKFTDVVLRRAESAVLFVTVPRLTNPENPFETIEIVDVAVLAADNGPRVDGVADIEKSG